MLIGLLLGTALIVLPIIVLVISLLRTPTGLRGYYGKMYTTLAGIAFIVGATLITLSFLGILG